MRGFILSAATLVRRFVNNYIFVASSTGRDREATTNVMSPGHSGGGAAKISGCCVATVRADGDCGRSLRLSSPKMAQHRLAPPALISPRKPHLQMYSSSQKAVLGAFAILLIFWGCRDGNPGGISGSGEASLPEVAFVTNGIAGFWTIARAGALDGGREFDVEVDVRMPAEGAIDQKRILEDLLARGVDGIAISPIDPDNQKGLLNESSRHTNLITQDSDAPETDRLCYVGMDNYQAGRLAGKLVKEALPDGGSIILFVGRLEQLNAQQRRQGVIDVVLGRPDRSDRLIDPPNEVLEGNNYTILDTRTDQFDRSKAKANAEDAIARYPELDGMVGLFEYNPPACLLAIQEAGSSNIKLIAFDEADETLQGIRDGSVYGTVVQQPYLYGYESIRILAGLAQGDRSVLPPNGFLHIPAQTIRKDNVEVFWTDLKDKLARGGQ